MKAIQVLKRPYPYLYRNRTLPKLILLVFGTIFLFLWLFEPFHVNAAEQRKTYETICLIHSFLPAAIFGLYFFLINTWLQEDVIDNWTVAKELLNLSILFFLFGVGSFLVRDILYTNPDNWTVRYFFEEVKNTFLGGTLLSCSLTTLNFQRLNFFHHSQAAQLNKTVKPQPKEDHLKVFIKTQQKAEDFYLSIHQFLFAKAEGNYVAFFCRTPHGVNKMLKRVTLLGVAEQLSLHINIIQTHRTYLVNVHNISQVEGNAQGYQLRFADTNHTAKVSRAYINTFNKTLS